MLIDASDGDEIVGLDRRLENVIAASWQALVDSLEYAEQPGRARGTRDRRAAAQPDEIPLARPVLGERGGGGASSRCCAPASCRSARACRRSSRRFAARLGAPHASAVSSGTAGLHLALRAVGVQRRRRGRHVAVLVRRERQRRRLRARAAGLRRHRPAHAEPRPARPRAAAVTDRTTRAAAGPHLRLPGRPAGVRGARPADRRGRLRGARRRPRRRRRRSARRGHPAVVRLLRQQAADDRRGRHGHDSATPTVKERIDSERNQGRAPDMGWLDHDRLGFNYRLSRHRLRARPRAARAPRRRCSPAARASPRCYREALAGHRGPRAAVRGRRRRPPRLVRLRRPAAARRRPRRRRSARCASAACRPSPTCRRST